MDKTAILIQDITDAFAQSKHVHLTEQHLAKYASYDSEEIREDFSILASQLGCNFYWGREDNGWIRSGGIVAQEGEVGYVFCMGPCDEAGFSPRGRLYSYGPLPPGWTPPTSSLWEWAKKNLGFYLDQTDAAESALGLDGVLQTMPDRAWVVRSPDANVRPRVASAEEIKIWDVLFLWWRIFTEIREINPYRRPEEVVPCSA